MLFRMNRVNTSSAPYIGLGVYFIAGAFYVLPSGMPQPADILLILSMLICLFKLSRIPSSVDLYLVLGLFVAWIISVNVIWFFIIYDYRLLIRVSFYIFNAMVLVFLVIVGLNDYERLRRVVWWACILALAIQLGFTELVPSTSNRVTGSFNNPNQLAYWALLLLSCLAVSKDREPLGYMDIFAFGAGLYLSVLTASRAGTLSILLLIALMIVTRRWRNTTLFAVLGLCSIFLVSELSTRSISELVRSESITSVTARLSNRLERAQEGGLPVLTERGYTRLLEHPKYLVFGAGEGGYDRVSASEKEFHSSLGNLLLSYGVVGLTLFLALMFVIFRNAPLPSLLYMAPIMAFGLTHQGLRFSEFWVFVGLVYAQARYRQSVAESSRGVGIGGLRRV